MGWSTAPSAFSSGYRVGSVNGESAGLVSGEAPSHSSGAGGTAIGGNGWLMPTFSASSRGRLSTHIPSRGPRASALEDHPEHEQAGEHPTTSIAPAALARL